MIQEKDITTSKTAELRMPNALAVHAITHKHVKHLQILITAKLLHNSRVKINQLLEEMDIPKTTGTRLIKKIVNLGWAGRDKKHLYPRSWRRLNLKKHGGLYLT